MKQYAIGLITGILLTASAVMFMGATSEQNEVGTYQMSGTANATYMLNTKTAEVHLLRFKPTLTKIIPQSYWLRSSTDDPFKK